MLMTDPVRLCVDGAERPQDHVVWRVVHGRTQGSRCSRRIHRAGATQRDAGDRRPRRAVLWVSQVLSVRQDGALSLCSYVSPA